MSRQRVPAAKRALGGLLGAVLTVASFASAFTFAAGAPSASAAAANETRGGFVAQIGQALCLVPDSGAAQKYADVPPSDPDFGEIMSASAEGWISGYPNGTFEPDGTLTREQMVKVEVIALGLGSQAAALSDQAPDYSDATSIGRWAWGFVNEATAIGIVHGFVDGSFGPTETFTTSEVTDALGELTAYLAAHDQPVVTAVTPGSGAAGGTVAVSGSGFCGASGVAFGSLPAASFVVQSTSSLTAVAPSGSGTVDLTVTTAKGTSAKGSPDLFSYTTPPPPPPPPPPPHIASYSVQAVASLQAITVPAGTAIGSLALPTTVGVTLSGGASQNLGVTWNGGTPAYDGNTAGTYAFTGTLTLPANVTNPSNLTAAQTVVVQAGPPAAATSSLTGPASAVTAGDSATYTLVLKDQYRNPIAGLAGQIALTQTGAGSGDVSFGAVIETATNGTYTFTATDDLAETFTVHATVAGLSLAASPETVTPAAASKLVITREPSTTAAGALTTQPVVDVTDQYGNVAATDTSTVTAALTTGAGSLGGTTAVTVTAGVANFKNLSIDTAAQGDVLTFTDGSLTPAVSQPFDVNPGGPSAKYSTLTGPASAVTAGDSATYTLVLADRHDNPLTGLAGQITLGQAGAATGDVSFSSVTETSTPGTYTFTATDNTAEHFTVSATVEGLTLTAAEETVAPASASKLVIAVEPSTTAAGVLTTQPVVDVTDQYGNVVTTDTSTVTASLTTGLGRFVGTAALQAASGVATFQNLELDQAAKGDVLTFTDGSLTQAISQPFDVLPGAPSLTYSSLTGQTTVPAGDTITYTLVLADRYDNPITGVAAQIQLQAQGARPGDVQFNAVAEIGTPGSYAFTVSDTKAETFTVAATVGGTTVKAAPETVVAAAASQLVVATEPSTTVDGVLTTQPVIDITDVYGNVATTNTSTMTATLTTGPGTVQGTTSVSASAGVVTFTNLEIDQVGKGDVLTFTDGLTTVQSRAFNVPVGPASPAASILRGPAAETAGVSASYQLTLDDAYGNPIANLPGSAFTPSESGVANTAAFSYGAVTANPASPGTYTFTVTDDAAGTFTVSVAVQGVTIQANPETVTAAAASQLAITQEPSTSTPGVLTTQPVVQVEDQYGNVVTTDTSTVTAALTAGSGTLAGTTSLAAVTGVVTFTNLEIDQAGKGDVLTFTDGPKTAVSAAFNVPVGPPSQSTSTLRGPSQETAGASASYQLVLADRYGNPITGLLSSAFGLSETGVANTAAVSYGKVTENLSSPGTYTFTVTDDAAGTFQVSAAVQGVTIQAASETVTAAAASRLVITQEPSTTAAGVLTTQPVVQVEDRYGNVVTTDASTVTASLTTGPGTLKGTVSLAAVAGVATFTNLEIDQVGQGDVLTFTDGALTPAPSAPFNVNPGAPSPTFSTLTGPTAPLMAGDVATYTLVLEDQYQNPITGLTGQVAPFQTGAGAGDVRFGGAAETSTLGTYTFTATDNTAESFTVSATADGLTLQAAPETVAPAAASRLVITREPSTTAAGVLTTQPVVQVEDRYGNLITTDASTVTASLTTGPGTLKGTVSLAAVAGIATFTNLEIDQVGQGDVLTFTDGALTLAPSAPFNVNPGAPSPTLSTLTGPTSPITAGDVATYTLVLEDQYKNPITGLAGQVTPGQTGALPGEVSFGGVAETSTLGTYTFTATDNTAESFTVSATAEGVTLRAAQETVVPAAATELLIATEPATTVAGVLTTQPVVEVTDRYGNVVTTNTSKVTVALTTGPGTLAGTTSVNAKAGVATFTNLAIDKAAQGDVLTFTDGTLTKAVSQPFNVNPGDPSPTLSTLTGPTSAVTAGDVATYTLVLEDQYKNPITGLAGQITMAQTGAGVGNVSFGGVAETSTLGTYTFTATDNTAESFMVSATAEGVTLKAAKETVVPAAASQLRITTEPSTTVAGVLTTQPVVEVTDQYGNVVTTNTSMVTAALTTGPGTLAGTTSVNAKAGVATFTNLEIDKAAQGDVLTFTTGTLSSASAPFNVAAGAPSPTYSSLTGPNGDVQAGVSATYTLVLADKYDNPITMGAISLSETGAALSSDVQFGSISTTSVLQQNAPITYVFTVTDDKAETFTVTATEGGVGITAKAETVVAGPAAQISLISPTSAISLHALGSVDITFKVTDTYGNPVQGVTVTFGKTGSLKGVIRKSATTGPDGEVTCTYQAILGEGTVHDSGTVTATIMVNGAPVTASSPEISISVKV